jgi:DNA polymerase-3 subunit epsilon
MLARALDLSRPLVVLDLESTGTNWRFDRIVEFAGIKVCPDGREESLTLRIRPEIPIPPEATAIHGISNDDVASCPILSEAARDILRFLQGADLCGFNILRFDLPLLTQELGRAGFSYPPANVRVIDAQSIFHKREPRTLSAALRFYCGREHTDAHGAEADSRATLAVLEGELARYPDLPRDLDALAQYCERRTADSLDAGGRLRWRDGEVAIAFGQHAGRTLRDLAERNPEYLNWILRKDFSDTVKGVVEGALKGVFPQKEEEQADESGM